MSFLLRRLASSRGCLSGLLMSSLLMGGQAVVAELRDLSEREMAEIEGAGVGLVLENFKFSHGSDQSDGSVNAARIFRIGGIKSTDGRDVEIIVNHLYISGPNSNYGETLSAVNLGRLVNPYRIDVVDGDTIGIPGRAVLELAAPAMVAATQGYDCLSLSAAAGSGICSSRPASAGYHGERADLGMQMNIAVGNDRSANINLHAKSAVIDGSYLRLWGDEDRKQMVGQFKLNFFSPEFSINACDQDGVTCGSRIVMSDFVMQLAIGNRLQPAFFDVDGTGNFVVDVAAIRKPRPGEIGSNGRRDSSNVQAWDYYEEYYTNPEYRSNLKIGNLSVGTRDFGSARVQGMLTQYLQIRTKDLAP